MSLKYLIAIVGPTAVGKTNLSIEIAARLNTEIISADSRQFFRELSIGTAKPSLKEMNSIVHHFIGSHSIFETFNAGSYETEAIDLIDKLFQKHEILLLVGGSGLYVDAVCKGFDELPKSDEKIRKELNEILKKSGITALQKHLKSFDPEYYKVVDLNNPHRLIRALEVIKQTGKPYSFLRKKIDKARNFKVIKIGIEMPRETLYERINLRVDEMIKKGLLQEVKNIYDSITNKEMVRDINALNSVGYKELINYLEGFCTLDEAIDLIKKNTRNFAKRQLTWFRKDNEINWFDVTDKNKIMEFINNEYIR